MQYILTQQEYNKLLTMSDETSKQTIVNLRIINLQLQAELLELKDKYAKLLVFGVSTNNEKLKQ
ncbi:MAG: hypothetical protein ACMV1B_03440 [Prevotella sp.]